MLHPMLLCGERGSPYLRKPSGKETQVWQQWGGPAAMLSTCDPDTWEADGMDVGACSVRGRQVPRAPERGRSAHSRLAGAVLQRPRGAGALVAAASEADVPQRRRVSGSAQAEGGSVGGRAGIRATWGGRDGLQLGGLGVYSTWRGLWKTQRRSLDPLASREPCPPECGSMYTPQASRGWLTAAGRGRRPGTSGRGLGGPTRSPGVCGRRACCEMYLSGLGLPIFKSKHGPCAARVLAAPCERLTSSHLHQLFCLTDRVRGRNS
ncbi:unnamed protein product [Rangifer tarandus platyrhynchus]|uniref:Uncharacterized protein n=1 Tax=Rangifer tarandus platyrhynchus TaxID=3082113 RepID=A0ABN8YM79_RANTA|nr:unnamed protein product [Rangifer tarandus platyrhynchus]